MRAPLTLLCLATACSAPPVPDGGTPDAGPDAGELDCPGHCEYRDAGACSFAQVDSPCRTHCRCRYGSTYDCMTVCPPIERCRHGGWCGQPTAGNPTDCGTDDAGCARECQCAGFIITYSSCVTRCGGAAFQCFDQERADGGCTQAFTCDFGTRACQCAPDAGWTCTH